MRQTGHRHPQYHHDSYTVSRAVFVTLLAPLLVVVLSVPTLVLAAALGALTALVAGPVTGRLRSIRDAIGGSGAETERAETRPSE